RMRHPGVVRFVDQGLHEGLPWYAMELIEGVSLRARIRGYFGGGQAELLEAQATISGLQDTSPVGATRISEPASPPASQRAAGGPLEEALTLVRRLCQTLAFLHGEGVVHRDLKPDNVLLLGDARPVLVDFGIMRRFAGAAGREALEVDHRAAGSVLYMPPEQI